ncbi:MAG: NERD domain-containing protein [Kiritimatiellae bacterium]|nr:NERD domain-containing protein [Kiritimatiellia bacterium]
MAKQHGVPGEWARVRGTVLSLWPLFLAFVLMGAFASAVLSGRHVGVFAFSFVASLVSVAWLWRKGLRRVESFFRGARGEERVANLLGNLPDAYHVFHDFVAGSHHVDHVVVGPTGVFAVETKNWSRTVTIAEGHVLVGGELPTRPPLVQAVKEAEAVKASLKRAGWNGEVAPVVCFASNTFAEGVATCGTVQIVNARDLHGLVTNSPEALPPQELERLVQLMEIRR